MSNHHRGLWGYHGETADGRELTVQSTGIGGPSAAIVLGELIELGLRRAVRIGTCIAPGPEPAAGASVLARAALAADGTSAALGASPGSWICSDPRLTLLLAGALELTPEPIASLDVPPPPPGEHPLGALDGRTVRVADLQTAALLTSARNRGLELAAVLVVASSGGRRLDDEPLEAKLLSRAGAAAAALQSL